ncbi:MAG: cytochrome C [Epsilonproteobacteria bacterium]|nr:MAG: cytochrome C [Campylobacterota bacterium]
MNRKTNKVFVWPFYTRLIHWLIAVSFLVAFVLSFYEHLLNLHAAFGVVFGLMLLYRIIWGFLGPNYAIFATFKLSFSALISYFREKIQNRYREIPAGHNPASSWYTLVVLGFGSVIAFSGLFLFGIQEGNGYLGYLNENYYRYTGILMFVHTFMSYILVGWAFVHIFGVLIEQFYHKTNMLFVMITGYKIAKGQDATPGKKRGLLTWSFLLLSCFVFFVSTDGRNNPFVVNRFKTIDIKKESPVYFEKCGTCHKAYPAFMLPSSSWDRIQSGLENHFGDEISPDHNDSDHRISLSEQTDIFKYLVNNSADNSTREISVKVMKSLDGARGRKSISKIKIWKDIHKNIKPHIYKSDQIKDRSNCFACHKHFEQGVLEDIDIQVPTNLTWTKKKDSSQKDKQKK